MKKIPTIFERDWNGDRSCVVPTQNPAADWVFRGEGIPTRKLDGTSCLILDGKFYKRRELKKGHSEPLGFLLEGTDPETGKAVGWVPVAPDDKWHMEAFSPSMSDGTYELIGPKVQGDPEHCPKHILVAHNDVILQLADVPRTFDGLSIYFDGRDIEGVVFHHPDGRMAKIKARDFGLKRVPDGHPQSLTPVPAPSPR